MDFKLRKFIEENLAKLVFVLFFAAFLTAKYAFNLGTQLLSELAMAVFLSILFLAFEEFIPSSKGGRKSTKDNLVETAGAVIAAVVLYALLGFLLHTPTPINVITSCSMLPAYDRGDLIVLSGDEPKAPVLNVTANSVFTFEKSPCTRIYNDGRQLQGSCTSELIFQGQPIVQVNKSNDLVVYDSQSSIGLIVHRVIAKVDASDGSQYYITKGDNNDVADQEFGIPPIPKNKVNGKVLFRIPFIGYIKLFLFLQFQEPQYCDSHLK